MGNVAAKSVVIAHVWATAVESNGVHYVQPVTQKIIVISLANFARLRYSERTVKGTYVYSLARVTLAGQETVIKLGVTTEQYTLMRTLWAQDTHVAEWITLSYRNARGTAERVRMDRNAANADEIFAHYYARSIAYETRRTEVMLNLAEARRARVNSTLLADSSKNTEENVVRVCVDDDLERISTYLRKGGLVKNLSASDAKLYRKMLRDLRKARASK